MENQQNLTTNPGKPLKVTVNGKQYMRYAIKTHFITTDDNYNEVIKKYVIPHYQQKDIIAISEKIISICQNNLIHKDDIRLSSLAKFFIKIRPHNSCWSRCWKSL